jgi:hypothetical protein
MGGADRVMGDAGMAMDGATRRGVEAAGRHVEAAR